MNSCFNLLKLSCLWGLAPTEIEGIWVLVGKEIKVSPQDQRLQSERQQQRSPEEMHLDYRCNSRVEGTTARLAVTLCARDGLNKALGVSASGTPCLLCRGWQFVGGELSQFRVRFPPSCQSLIRGNMKGHLPPSCTCQRGGCEFK